MSYSAGDVLPERQFGPVTRTDFVRYQGASGDFNPIHHDDPYAQSAGFPSVFSVGMLQAGYLATYVTDVFGAANVRRFKIQFREQVWPGDVLTCSGKVASTASTERSGEALVELELQVTTQKGAAAIVGTALVAV